MFCYKILPQSGISSWFQNAAEKIKGIILKKILILKKKKEKDRKWGKKQQQKKHDQAASPPWTWMSQHLPEASALDSHQPSRPWHRWGRHVTWMERRGVTGFHFSQSWCVAGRPLCGAWHNTETGGASVPCPRQWPAWGGRGDGRCQRWMKTNTHVND